MSEMSTRKESIMKQSLAQKEKAKTKAAKVREIPILLTETKNLDKDQLAEFCRSLNELEIKALVDFAYVRNEDQKAAKKDYDSARMILQAHARLTVVQNLSGEGAAATFESRDHKEVNAWKVLQELRKTSFWINGDKADQIALFNRIFNVRKEDAKGILGSDLLDKCTDVTTDAHAVLKLKSK